MLGGNGNLDRVAAEGLTPFDPSQAQQLTTDLQRVAWALARPEVATNRGDLRGYSHCLMPMAEKLGAIRLYLLAEELHDRAGNPGCTQFATPLVELRTLLHQLILSVQATRNAWLIRR